jgi:hypothetical protein
MFCWAEDRVQKNDREAKSRARRRRTRRMILLLTRTAQEGESRVACAHLNDGKKEQTRMAGSLSPLRLAIVTDIKQKSSDKTDNKCEDQNSQ